MIAYSYSHEPLFSAPDTARSRAGLVYTYTNTHVHVFIFPFSAHNFRRRHLSSGSAQAPPVGSTNAMQSIHGQCRSQTYRRSAG